MYSWIDPEIAKKDRKGKGLHTDVLSRVEKGVEEGDGWHLKVEPGEARSRPFARPLPSD